MAIGGHWSKCYRCSCDMWLPPALYEAALASAGVINFYCAYGHGQRFKPTEQIHEEDQIRRERDRLKQENARLAFEASTAAAHRKEAERKLALAVKSAARTVKRIHAGVCPHCNRSFEDLRRHMASKHKEAAE